MHSKLPIALPSAALLLILLSAVLLSCAGKIQKPLYEVYITDQKKITLLPPNCIEKEHDEEALFTGTFGKRTFSALSYLNADAKGIDITILNELGVSLGTLSFSEEGVSFDSAYFPKSIKAEYIVADLQNVYYSVPRLQENYGVAGLSFSATTLGKEETRSIYDGSTLIEKITLSDKRVVIQNYLRGYSYELLSLE